MKLINTRYKQNTWIFAALLVALSQWINWFYWIYIYMPKLPKDDHSDVEGLSFNTGFWGCICLLIVPFLLSFAHDVQRKKAFNLAYMYASFLCIIYQMTITIIPFGIPNFLPDTLRHASQYYRIGTGDIYYLSFLIIFFSLNFVINCKCSKVIRRVLSLLLSVAFFPTYYIFSNITSRY